MIEYAKWQFKLGKKDDNGITLRRHLEQIWKSTREKPEQLEEPYFPELLTHVWEWFTDLHLTRPSGFGTSPIQYAEILAWMTVTGEMPTPWEVGLLKKLDRTYLVSNEKTGEGSD